MRTVLHVTPYLHPSAGGPVVVVQRYARLLPGLGYQSAVLTTDWFSPGGREELEKRHDGAFELHVLGTGNRFLEMAGRTNSERVRRAVSGADLLHVHGLWHALGWQAMRQARSMGVPYIVSTHGMLDPYSMSVRTLRKRAYWRLVESRNVRHAARTLFTTEAERELAHSVVGDLGATDVVLLGADGPPAESPDALRESALARFPALRGRRIVLFFGRLHEKKGLQMTVRLFRKVIERVPGAFLLVVGDGEPGYVQRVQSEIARLGLEGAVIFAGLLEGRDKWAAIATADAFVLPSMQENFALAVAEVMKLGVPVVVSDRVNLASYVQGAGAGEVIGLQDEEGWVRAICRMLEDAEWRHTASRNAFDLAADSFSWDRSARATAAIYADVLNTDRQAGIPAR